MKNTGSDACNPLYLEVLYPQKVECNMPNDKLILLARKIEFALKAKKLKKFEFAKLMGKHPAEISRWLSGYNNFTVDTLINIEEQLDIRLLDV